MVRSTGSQRRGEFSRWKQSVCVNNCFDKRSFVCELVSGLTCALLFFWIQATAMSQPVGFQVRGLIMLLL